MPPPTMLALMWAGKKTGLSLAEMGFDEPLTLGQMMGLLGLEKMSREKQTAEMNEGRTSW